MGGALKTLAEADKESLQAQWFKFEEQHLSDLPQLRGYDIVGLIQLAKKWYAAASGLGCAPHRILPVRVGHSCSSIRIIAVHEGEG